MKQIKVGIEALEPRGLLAAISGLATVPVAVTPIPRAALPPPTVTLKLDAATASNPSGVILVPRVILEGQATPHALVRVEPLRRGAPLRVRRADGSGAYRVQVTLPLGTSTVAVEAIDASHRVAFASLTLTRGQG